MFGDFIMGTVFLDLVFSFRIIQCEVQRPRMETKGDIDAVRHS